MNCVCSCLHLYCTLWLSMIVQIRCANRFFPVAAIRFTFPISEIQSSSVEIHLVLIKIVQKVTNLSVTKVSLTRMCHIYWRFDYDTITCMFTLRYNWSASRKGEPLKREISLSKIISSEAPCFMLAQKLRPAVTQWVSSVKPWRKVWKYWQGSLPRMFQDIS